MVTTTLLLARHGQTDWNRDGRFQGHADPPLNAQGREQARALANELEKEPLTAVYSSDLRRAYETARFVAVRKGLEVRVDPQLRERDVGHWSGLTRAEIEERFPEELRLWHEGAVACGETREALAERVVAAARRIAAAHSGERVLVVTHGGALRMLRHAAGASPDAKVVENGRIVRIAIEEGVLRGLD
jgi:probable phosphoglycerate mutase